MTANKISFAKITRHPLFAGFTVFSVVLIINAILDPRFFAAHTIYGNLWVVTPIIIATMAQGIVILSGSIDLSIGASISLMNCLLAVLLKDSAGSVIGGLMLSLVIMLAISCLNGVLVAYFRLPSMVATFAVSTMLSGITLLVLSTPGGYIPGWLPFGYSIRFFGLVPITVFILLLVGLIWYSISRTKLGRYFYAVGGNEAAAASSGINAKRTKVYAFMCSGFFIWLAAVCVTGQTGAGDFRLGAPYTLTTIAAAIMGGVALSGGKGKILGAALGGCVMIFITNIIYWARIPSFYQDMIRGLIVIIVLCIAAIPQMKSRTV